MYVSGSVTIKVMVNSYTITSIDNNFSEDDAEQMNKVAKIIMEDNIPYEKVPSKICDTGHEFWEKDGLQKVVCLTSVEDTKGTISCMGALSSKQLHMCLLSLLATRLLSRTYSVNFKVALTYFLISGERSA